jgi:hypothetical protein
MFPLWHSELTQSCGFEFDLLQAISSAEFYFTLEMHGGVM